MVRIGVAVAGDHWCNRDEVIAAIAVNHGADTLVLDMNTEGPSLNALGITDAVLEAAAKTAITADQIWVDRWHNTVETIPFRRATNPVISHFFWMSNSYRHVKVPASRDCKLFALFVGRATSPRAVIMHELWRNHRDDTLFSLMRGHGASVNTAPDLDQWLAEPEKHDLQQWFVDPPIRSLTGHCVRDQYTGGHNTNAALAEHYGRFAVEIVCETYCKGETFFPTEKTVRPLALAKPMLIYGPRHFLKRLRELGFSTWHDVWPEDYDELEGPARWRVMLSLVSLIKHDRLWQHPDLAGIAQHNVLTLQHLIQRHAPS
jgi:hypothetical protein